MGYMYQEEYAVQQKSGAEKADLLVHSMVRKAEMISQE